MIDAPQMSRAELVEIVSYHLQRDEPVQAAKQILIFSGKVPDVTDLTQAYTLLNYLLHWCLNNDAYVWAAKLCWGDNLFNPNPRSTNLIWNAINGNYATMLMGAASMSKSYSTGVWLMLDWIRDPEFTTIKVIGPSEQHLEDNLFSHLVRLHRESKIPLPGIIGELFIGLDSRNRRGSISGVIIPVGKKKSGRIQGVKRVPRPKPHPTFGLMSRLRIFIDESEIVPTGIWRDIDNVLANVEGVDGFKLICAFNPEDMNGQSGSRCEPVGGWKEIDIEQSERWMSKRGWAVVRLDAFRCENVVQDKIIYPGLQTKEGLDKLIQNAGGYNTPGYYTMARAWFPPDGVNFSVIPMSMLSEIKAEYIWLQKTTPCAAADIALEGGDNLEIATGQWGIASGVRFPPSPRAPRGEEQFFKDVKGRATPRYCLQIDQIFQLPKGDTVQQEASLRQLFQSLGIQPDWVMLDRTGNGAGVHDLMKNNWSPAVRGVNYSESSTDMKILTEDTQKCSEAYDRICSEVWFALKKFIEFAYVKISALVETETLFSQLSSRLFHAGKKNKVESKREYKSRGNKSPDKADVVTLLVHCVRCASGITVGMAVEPGEFSDDESDDLHHVDVTNKIRDDL